MTEDKKNLLEDLLLHVKNMPKRGVYVCSYCGDKNRHVGLSVRQQKWFDELMGKTQELSLSVEGKERSLRKLLDSPELLEALSELEHQQWVKWASTLLQREPNISEERRRRWIPLFMPYNYLPEETKEQDRVWARKVLKKLFGEEK